MNKKLFNLIEKFQDKKSPLAVLSMAKIANGYIEVTDQNATIRAKIEHEGEGLIDVTELKKIFQRNDVDKITIKDGEYSLVTCGKKQFKLSGGFIEDFPIVPTKAVKWIETIVEDLPAVSITKEFLSLKDFVGNDDTRPVMSGVHWNSEHQEFVATDAHVMRWIPAPTISENIIIPPKVFLLPENEYKTSLVKELVLVRNYETQRDEETVITTHIMFENDEFQVILRLIDGRYPDYKAVIPTDNPTTLVVFKNEFVECLNDALICANPVALYAKLDTLGTLTSKDLSRSTAFKAELTHELDGEGMEIGFNIKTMLNNLKSINEEVIELSMSRPNRSFLINGNTLQMPVLIEGKDEEE